MDGRRARHIMESHGIIDVRFKNSPVWLEGIRDEIAEVTFIDTGKRSDIPVSQLEEE